MQKETQKNLNYLYKKLKLYSYYNHALSIMSFDFETCAPKDSKEAEGEVISYFSNKGFKIITYNKVKSVIVYLFNHINELEELDKVLVKNLYEEYQKVKNVSASTQMKWSMIFNKAYIDWLLAKEKADFSVFAPSLKKIVDVIKEQVSLRENKLPVLYDNLLNDYEKGMLTEQLDAFFTELKEGLLTLINKIKKSKHQIRSDFLSRKVPIYKQEVFSNYILKLNGYDFNRGCLTTTEHPFTSPVAKNDARVTTHYYEDMVLSNIFSVIHEGGHAIFMQNQRNEDYTHLIYPEFIKIFGDELGDVSERELYEAINIVEPSLIRTEADEVTYGLHIIIRYEIEKLICSDKIAIKDIPAKWNELYKEYLGVEPKNDAEGVLQDVHWTSGFGYFPSYALGNAYKAMYKKKKEKAIDFKGSILKGDFKAINGWMKNNVFYNANVLDPVAWLKNLTGKRLSAKDFLDYLNEKYSDIYRLN